MISYSILFVLMGFFFLKKKKKKSLYVFLLFLKIGENNFYLLFENCSPFHLFLKTISREQQLSSAMNFKI